MATPIEEKMDQNLKVSVLCCCWVLLLIDCDFEFFFAMIFRLLTHNHDGCELINFLKSALTLNLHLISSPPSTISTTHSHTTKGRFLADSNGYGYGE
jgi:hypothetical protein